MSVFKVGINLAGKREVEIEIKKVSKETPKALDRTITKVGGLVHQKAIANLSGAGAKKSKIAAGGFPVPVRTGWIRRLEYIVAPGKSKSLKTGTPETPSQLLIKVPKHQMVLGNSADYAVSVHDGTFSNTDHGPRRFLFGALEEISRSGIIDKILAQEVAKTTKGFT